jgi:dCMP deaminase
MVLSPTSDGKKERSKMNKNQQSWDQFFYNVCQVVASNSKCYSRKLGAILVKDKSIISTGYNGVARGIPHCETRYLKDEFLKKKLMALPTGNSIYTCPRRALGFESGEGMEYCYSQHAETNCLNNACRLGVPTVGSTLFLNFKIPCLHCLQACINAGIKEIVVTKLELYNKQAKFILDHSNILIREFEI